jgi:hypothetical protein
MNCPSAIHSQHDEELLRTSMVPVTPVTGLGFSSGTLLAECHVPDPQAVHKEPGALL